MARFGADNPLAGGKRTFPGGLSGRQRAFTLVEMLVSLAVFAIISGALLSVLISASRRVEYIADYRKAANRVAAVEAFLRGQAAYCGYGIPLEADRYKAAFGNAGREPFNWDGPVSTGTAKQQFTDNRDKRVDNALFIAYARPGASRVKKLTVLNKENLVIQLNQAPQNGEIEVTKPGEPSCKSFICFGSAIPPKTLLRTAMLKKTSLTINLPDVLSVTVQKGDRMRLFRAMTIFAYRDNMYTYDYSGSGKQPRLGGICDLRFSVDMRAKKLTAYVMARGDKKYGRRQPVKGVTEWPEAYRADSYVNKENYLLLVGKIVLELPNCQPSNILNSENITEAF